MAPAPKLRHPPKGRRSRRRGQAMVEYSMLNALLVMALMIAGSMRVIPFPGGRLNVIEVMLWAYHVYYDGIYLVLSSPYP